MLYNGNPIITTFYNGQAIVRRLKNGSDVYGTQGQEISLADLQEPFVIGHRGGANTYPENTLTGYQSLVKDGFKVLEQDVQRLSDDALVVMHDPSIDRTTTGTGNVSTFNSTTWKDLRVDPTSFIGSSGYVNTNPPLLEEVFSEFGKSVIYFPEVKDTTGATKLVALIQKYGLQNNVVVQANYLPALQPALDVGLRCLALIPSTDFDTAVSMGVTYVSFSSTSPTADSFISTAISKGLKPVVYTIDGMAEWNRWKAKGVVACFADDPVWTAGLTTPKLTSDPFATKRWFHGHIGATSDRGVFVGTDRWGFPSGISEERKFCLQGWAGKLTAPSYSITFKMTFDSIPDTSAWGAIGFCTPTDDKFNDNTSVSSGYLMLLRGTGVIGLYTDTNGSGSSIGTLTTNAISVGGSATIKIDVTPTAITITRLDDANKTVTVNNTLYRSGYVHFGRKTNGVSFSQVTIS